MSPLSRTSGPHMPRSSAAMSLRSTPPDVVAVEPRRATPRPSPRSGVAWAALTRAVDRLCADEARPRPDGVSHGVLADALATIETAVHSAADGAVPPLGAVPGFVHANRVAGTLRWMFLTELEAASSPSDTQELIRVLVAFERVEEALEADAGQRFLTKLSGMEAPKLLAEVAHDMRSPLGSILFLAERLRNGQSGPVTPLQARQLGLVYSAALGLSGLSNDVMELARGGLRLMDPEPVPFSVADILQQTINIVRPMAEEKGLLLEATVPELDGRVGFPAALQRVLLNLTTNALKFTEKGSVRIASEPTDRMRLDFSVSDTGRGIPPAVMHTLFDAFRHRGPNSDYFFSSAGLGLATCHKLVAAMGGELKVDSVVDRGTRFSFQLDLPAAFS